jgi:hypothetical protein
MCLIIILLAKLQLAKRRANPMLSEALNTVKDFRKNLLIDLYNQCNPDQQLMFRRMYSHKNLDLSIDSIVEIIPEDRLDWATQQCENTIKSNKKRTMNNAN